MKENKCVIRSNETIKLFLIKRMEEEKINYKDIIIEARKNRLKISKSSFSRWMSADGYKSGSLTQKQILWLCKRYGINVSIKIEYQEEYDPLEAKIKAREFIETFNLKY